MATGRVGSAPRVEFDFDMQKLGQVRSALAALGDKQDAAIEAVLTEEAEDVIAAADEIVPADIGNLKGSKFVAPPEVQGSGFNRYVTVELGYGNTGTLYAASVHENPRSGQTGGKTPSGGTRKTWAKVGQWKYLETPWLASSTGWLDRVGNKLWERVRGGGGGSVKGPRARDSKGRFTKSG